MDAVDNRSAVVPSTPLICPILLLKAPFATARSFGKLPCKFLPRLSNSALTEPSAV